MIDRKKLILPIVIFLSFIIIIILISLILMNLNPQSDRTDSDLINPKYIAIFQNEYQLNYTIGESSAQVVFNDIDSVITLPDEVSSATDPISPTNNTNAYLTSTIIETSFKKIANLNDDHAYSFNLDISDSRSYFVVVRTDPTFGNNYIFTFIKNLSTSNSYLVSNSTNKVDNSIIEWGNSLGFNNPEIINYSE